MPPRFFRRFRRRESPEHVQPQTTSSQSPSNDTGASRSPALLLSQNTASPSFIHRDESRASYVTPAPPIAPAQPSSGSSGDSKWWSSILSVFKARSRRTSANRVGEPRRPDTEPAQLSTSDPNSSSEGHINKLQSTPNNTTAISGTSTQPRLKTENLLSTNTPSSQTPTPSPSGPDGGKKTVISTVKSLLQATAGALKFVPIPNLDQIPNTLLAWIQIYEVCESLPVAIGDDLSLTFHLNICRMLPEMMKSSKSCST